MCKNNLARKITSTWDYIPLRLETKQMLTKILTSPEHSETLADPFALGWRLVPYTLADGQLYHERIPLTLNDILHPQVGDFRVHSTNHELFCDYFSHAFKGKFHDDPHVVVLHDVRVAWAIPEMDAHGPDISVIFNVKERKNWSTFDEIEEGTRPSLIVEVTSPATRKVDLETKLLDYALVGVEYYLIIDMKRKSKKEHYVLLGYVLQGRRYEKMEPDERGWLWLPPVGLWVGIENNRPYCYDEQGKRVADYIEIKVQLEQEVEARQKEAAARQQAEDQLREMAAELKRLRDALASGEK